MPSTRPISARIDTDASGITRALGRLEDPCYVVATENWLELTNTEPGRHAQVVTAVGPLPPERLGPGRFRAAHGVRYSYVGGAMAGGISSADMVIALARAGCLGSFGSGGLPTRRIDEVLARLQTALPHHPYAVNLLHTPNEQRLERDVVQLCLRHRVRCVEASAFMDLSESLIRYRLLGLRRGPNGAIITTHRVMAKVSRVEIAEKFLAPAPQALVRALLTRGEVTPEQAELARFIPVADDITVEADSGGHTDRRPLTALFPVMMRLRNDACRRYPATYRVQLGAAGGIGTPAAVTAAYALGADYVVTGSINQACVEAGTSLCARRMLASASIVDVDMAPSADMFEFGSRVQVLKKGTMFSLRARKLYAMYTAHSGLHELSPANRSWLESQIFHCSLERVWDEVVEFFTERDPEQIRRAENDPKQRMALIFRSYLGRSSRWASTGDAHRVADYQIWCGPAMGSFNAWAKGTYLAAPENRSVANVAGHLLRGAAMTARVQQLALSGVRLAPACTEYRPAPGVSGMTFDPAENR